VFVFDLANNQDIIVGFEVSKDLIDLSALDFLRFEIPVPTQKLPPQAIAALVAHNPKVFEVNGFDALDSNANGVLDDGDDCVSVAGDNTLIDLGAAVGGTAAVDTVTVVGQSALVAADFIF